MEQKRVSAGTTQIHTFAIDRRWVRFRVVEDATDRPVAGVELQVCLPGNRSAGGATDASGELMFDDLAPGVCAAMCELRAPRLSRTLQVVAVVEDTDVPSRDRPAPSAGRPPGAPRPQIAAIEAHRVRAGESLDSLGGSCGLGWRELALFNWDTASPKEISERLFDSIGCTKKTRDGRNYRFDDTDDPGIVYVPRQWSREGLATKRTYIVRVRRVEPFYILLQNTQKLRIPEAEYEATFADGSKRSGRLGRCGIALVENPPSGRVEVTFPDLDDVEAKSLAACALKAFKDRDTRDIFRLLEHSPTMVNRAISAYAQYFNEHTGNGLVDDIYEEFTDPLALTIAEGALAEAGVATRRPVRTIPWREQHGDRPEPV